MKRVLETLRNEDSIKEAILYTTFELSHRKWKQGFCTGEKTRTVTMPGILINFKKRMI